MISRFSVACLESPSCIRVLSRLPSPFLGLEDAAFAGMRTSCTAIICGSNVATNAVNVRIRRSIEFALKVQITNGEDGACSSFNFAFLIAGLSESRAGGAPPLVILMTKRSIGSFVVVVPLAGFYPYRILMSPSVSQQSIRNPSCRNRECIFLAGYDS